MLVHHWESGCPTSMQAPRLNLFCTSRKHLEELTFLTLLYFDFTSVDAEFFLQIQSTVGMLGLHARSSRFLIMLDDDSTESLSC